MNEKKYAFWKYDLFPHLVGGEIEKEMADGVCEVKGYGRYQIKPSFVLSGDAGANLLGQLKAIERKYHIEKEQLAKKFEVTVFNAIQLAKQLDSIQEK